MGQGRGEGGVQEGRGKGGIGEPGSWAGVFSLEKRADRENLKSGDLVEFEIVFTNEGAKPLTEIVIFDRLHGLLTPEGPSEGSVFDREGQLLRWRIRGPIPGQATRKIKFRCRVGG
jgi:uncharacterized repeat protein (TIGR01451 family)